MKQRDPGFFDYPHVWGAIAATVMSALILVAMAFGREPRAVDIALSISGFYMLAWLFSAARLWLMLRHR